MENLTSFGSGGGGLVGNALDNVITGGSNGDWIDGGAGADTMIGGGWDDVYVVDNVGDIVIESPNQGTDRVNSSITYTLGTNVEQLWITDAGKTGSGNAQNNVLVANADNVTLNGGAGNDTYVIGNSMTGATGSGPNGVVVGTVIVENSNGGVDTVESKVSFTLPDYIENLQLTGGVATATGNGLNNVLTSSSNGNGGDTLIGGAGDDTYVLAYTNCTVVESFGEGMDTVQTFGSYTLSANLENLTLVGIASATITGNDLDNIITGNSNSNTLDGGTGADTLIGGQANDTYIVDNVGDTVVENVGEGTDRIFSLISLSAVANVEEIWLTADGLTASGNASSNTLVANANNSTLIGGLGNDTFTIKAGVTGTTIVENADEGVDTVRSEGSYTLLGNLENLTLAGPSASTGTGNALSNILTASIAGDHLIGGAGDDTYVLLGSGIVVTENAGEGVDTVQVSASYTLTDNIENLTLTGSLGYSGTGNALANTIIGNAETNTLDGSAGADTLIGGLGNDVYIVDLSDTIIENAGEGVDTVQSAVSYVLAAANVENLTLTGTNAINGTGNSLNNILYGNIAANVLDGGTGADTMQGSFGDDIYIVDNANDLIVEDPGAGSDTVQTALNYTLGSNLDNLTLTGTSAVNGIGNGLNNTIIGNAAANTLFGDAGNDRLTGGAGNDVVDGGDGDDRILATLSDGNDTVTGGNGWDMLWYLDVPGAVSINQFDGIVHGSAGDDILLDIFEQIVGSNYNDILAGGNGINCIDGMGGDDQFWGNGGTDLLRGQEGNDTFRMLTNDGDDQMMGGDGFDTLSYAPVAGAVSVNLMAGTTAGSAGNDTLLDSFEQVIGTAFADIIAGDNNANTLQGGGGNDNIWGNGGADTLIGGIGNDTIRGGAGSDTFVFNRGDGADTITDFVVGTGSDDVINLHNVSGFTNFAQVQAAATQVGADTVINLGSGDQITLLNVIAPNLHQDDFIFI